jgi:murein L,D-transpeptidase YafK
VDRRIWGLNPRRLAPGGGADRLRGWLISGRFALLSTYPICHWSGQLGPKIKAGDRQAPEGFYTITPGLMNPNSSQYLAINTGYPNAYDRANGLTGAFLMIHGGCSSAGCYAMTDEQIAEISRSHTSNHGNAITAPQA